jgi:hypothetical protein
MRAAPPFHTLKPGRGRFESTLHLDFSMMQFCDPALVLNYDCSIPEIWRINEKTLSLAVV